MEENHIIQLVITNFLILYISLLAEGCTILICIYNSIVFNEHPVLLDFQYVVVQQCEQQYTLARALF